MLDNMAHWPTIPEPTIRHVSEAPGTNSHHVTHPQVTQLCNHMSEVIKDQETNPLS